MAKGKAVEDYCDSSGKREWEFGLGWQQAEVVRCDLILEVLKSERIC